MPVTVTARRPLSASQLLYLRAFEAEAKASEHRTHGRQFQANMKQREFRQLFTLAITTQQREQANR